MRILVSFHSASSRHLIGANRSHLELIPFWDSPRSKWHSSALKDTTKFNYTYPELKGLNINDPSTPAYVMKLVTYLYNNGPKPTPVLHAASEMKVQEAPGRKANPVPAAAVSAKGMTHSHWENMIS
jgi:hypothetical protein